MRNSETLQDRVSIGWALGWGVPHVHADGPLRVREGALTGLLRSSGMTGSERSNTFITVAPDSSAMPVRVTPKVKPLLPFLHVFSKEKVRHDELIIQANPSSLSAREGEIDDILASRVSAFGHSVKHRRIRSRIGQWMTFGAVSGGARLAFGALNLPLPKAEIVLPSLPLVGQEHLTISLLTTFAVGSGAVALAHLLRRPFHERNYEKKKQNTRAYARRIGPIITA